MTEPAPQLPAPEPESEVKLSFMEHLRDLRVRLTRALLGVLVGTLAIGAFVDPIFEWLMAPVHAALPEGLKLVYLNPVEPLMVYLKVAMYGGVFAAMPWVLFQLWLFVAPGLYKREKRVVIPFLTFGTVLFFAGAAFCRYVVMPPAFPAMLGIANANTLTPMLSMSATLGIVLAMLLGFGVVFEVPVIIAFLAMIGVVNAAQLSKFRRVAIVVNTIGAAIITPTGDPINLALMAVPMIVFYEIGIILARVLGKKPAPSQAIAKA
jgi:sec-independent protein translocase protein TatC